MSQIFLGAGEVSAAQCYKMHRELERAFKILSGIQQPQHWNHDPSPRELLDYADEVQEGRVQVDRIAREIYESLTGKKIVVAELS